MWITLLDKLKQITFWFSVHMHVYEVAYRLPEAISAQHGGYNIKPDVIIKTAVNSALKPRAVMVSSLVNLTNMYDCVELYPLGAIGPVPDRETINLLLSVSPSSTVTTSQHDSVSISRNTKLTIWKTNCILLRSRIPMSALKYDCSLQFPAD